MFDAVPPNPNPSLIPVCCYLQDVDSSDFLGQLSFDLNDCHTGKQKVFFMNHPSHRIPLLLLPT